MNDLDQSIRNLGMWCHLAALAGLVIPFGSILGPIIIWQTNKDKHPFVDEQGKEATNFQLSMLLYGFILAIILIPFMLMTIFSTAQTSSNSPDSLFASIMFFQFIVMLFALFNLVVTIVAAVRATNGQSYRYPLNLRFIK